MSLAYTPSILSKLRNANLLLDTCTIIDASNCDEINDFLEKLSALGCTFLSLPAVREEFTCSAKNLNDYGKLSSYINSLGIVFLNNAEKNLSVNDNATFNIALKRCKNIHPSYVDRMLMAVPYLYRYSSEEILLVTSNHKDIPRELFELKGFITYSDNIFHNIGIYKFNVIAFDKIISNI